MIMSPDALWRLALAIALFGIGYLVIRALNLHLPAPGNLRDFVLASFWKYPPHIERKRIFVNKIAWFCVVLTAYLITQAVF